MPSKDSIGPVSDSGRPEPPILLIIEDNPDMVEFLSTCLNSHYQTEVAYDGTAGIGKALELVPDIIICDVMLPGADGYEICATLKQDIRTSHIPIVLLTGRVETESRIAGWRSGADVYLTKPFELDELLATLESLLETRRRLRIRYASHAPATAHVSQPQEHAFIVQLKAIIEANLADDQYGLPELCQAIGMSRSQLFRKMKALIDEPPSSFVRSYRLYRAKELLENSDLKISEIAYKVGFKDPAYFSFAFYQAFHCTPSSVRMR